MRVPILPDDWDPQTLLTVREGNADSQAPRRELANVLDPRLFNVIKVDEKESAGRKTKKVVNEVIEKGIGFPVVGQAPVQHLAPQRMPLAPSPHHKCWIAPSTIRFQSRGSHRLSVPAFEGDLWESDSLLMSSHESSQQHCCSGQDALMSFLTFG